MGVMLNPRFRRLLSGAWLDLQSLPRRAVDPQRRSDPWQWRHNVGGGDFREAGCQLLDQLVVHGGLTPDCDVLDIGCGVGRTAKALASFLDRDAGYTGFDVSPAAIAICNKTFKDVRPDFRFIHADVRNTEYRPSAAQAETDYRFPAKDGGMDLAFAFSVFTHMRQDSIRRYVAEAHRVLRLGGRLVFTAYLLTPERITALARGEGSRRFQPWQDGAMVMDPRSPERAIAHPREAVMEAVRSAGLEIAAVLDGAWIGQAQYAGGQDLVVASKPA